MYVIWRESRSAVFFAAYKQSTTDWCPSYTKLSDYIVTSTIRGMIFTKKNSSKGHILHACQDDVDRFVCRWKVLHSSKYVAKWNKIEQLSFLQSQALVRSARKKSSQLFRIESNWIKLTGISNRFKFTQHGFKYCWMQDPYNRIEMSISVRTCCRQSHIFQTLVNILVKEVRRRRAASELEQGERLKSCSRSLRKPLQTI